MKLHKLINSQTLISSLICLANQVDDEKKINFKQTTSTKASPADKATNGLSRDLPLSQPRLQILIPASGQEWQARCTTLSVDEALAPYDLSLVCIRSTQIQAGSVHWALFGPSREPLARGDGIPEGPHLAQLLSQAGIHPSLTRLRQFVLTNPECLPARLAFIQCLLRGSLKHLQTPDAPPPSSEQDFKRHGELAKQIREFFRQTDWPLRSEAFAATLSQIPAPCTSSTLQQALSSGLPELHRRCLQDPTNFGLWSTLLISADLLEKPLDSNFISHAIGTLPPFMTGPIPFRLPALLRDSARKSGQWREVLPALRTLWEEGGRTVAQSYLDATFSRTRGSASRITPTYWEHFALPYFEALIQINDQSELLEALASLDEGWNGPTTRQVVSSMAEKVGRPSLAQAVRKAPRVCDKPVFPGILAKPATILFRLSGDRIQAEALAGSLTQLGVPSEAKNFESRWDTLAGLANSDHRWVVINRWGEAVDSGVEWAPQPEETAQRIAKRAIKPTWDVARQILQDRPGDPEALALLASTQGEALNALRIRLQQAGTPDLESRFQDQFHEYLETTRKIFACDRLPRAGLMPWVLNPLLRNPVPPEFSDQVASLCRLGVQAVESHLAHVPDEIPYWETWSKLKGLLKKPAIPGFPLPAGMPDLGLGPYPPPQVWALLAWNAEASDSPESLSTWLLPLLSEDLRTQRALPRPRQADDPIRERARIGIALLAGPMIRSSQEEALESYLRQCADLGLRGIVSESLQSGLPEEGRSRFDPLLRALQ